MTIYKYPEDQDDIIKTLQGYEQTAKLLRGNIIDLGSSFDIETTADQEQKTAYMYIWQWGIGDCMVYGRTWGDFLNFYTTLVKCLRIGKPTSEKAKTRRKLITLIHNFSYEWSFIKCRLPWQNKKSKFGYTPNVFAKTPRDIITAVTRQNIEFRCTYALTGVSLEKLAKDYKLSPKLTGWLDYDKPRNSLTPLDSQELSYALRDVEILLEFWPIYRDMYINKDQKIPTTKTAITRIELHEHFKKSGCKIPEGFPTTPEGYKYIMNWLFRGGYCHTNAGYTDWKLGPDTDPTGLDGYDFKSSYPTRMLLDIFPYKFVKFEGTFADLQKVLRDYKKAVIMTLRFHNLRSRTTHSLESFHKCINRYNPKYGYKFAIDNGRVSSAEIMTVCINELDWASYNEMYVWDSVELLGDAYVSDKKPLPAYLLDLVCKYYYQKESIKDKDSIDYMLAKQILNSFYGLCCSSVFHSNYIFDGEEMVLEDFTPDWDKLANRQIVLPQWGIWISAYARRECIKILTKYIDPNDAVYADTDSWKIRHPLAYRQTFEEYNRQMDLRLLGTDFSKLDFKYVGCNDEYELKQKLLGLGHFEFEAHIKRIKALGCKRYIFEDDKGKYVVKCAGMTKKSFTDLMEREKDTDPFELFHFDLTIPANYSHKMSSTYQLKSKSIITDSYGNTEEMGELSSVCLTPIPFCMKSNSDYLSWFTAIQEHLRRKY